MNQDTLQLDLSQFEEYISVVKAENEKITQSVNKLISMISPKKECVIIPFVKPPCFAPKLTNRPTLRANLI